LGFSPRYPSFNFSSMIEITFYPKTVLSVIHQGGIEIRYQLIVLLIALLIIPSYSQSLQISGGYGKQWLANTGSSYQFSEATGMWDWGGVPKGREVQNGKLTQTGPGMLVYPAFPVVGATPIFVNATTPGTGLNATNQSVLSDPNLYLDPFTIAQTNDRPVLFRTNPY
jgi:hypothetical protein